MFSKAVKVFSINRIDIKIDPSWLLIATLITWGLSQQYFPHAIEGQTPGVYLGLALVAMICFFASLLAHELAHALVAQRNHIDVKGITLFLFGGLAELQNEARTPLTEFKIAIAGPLTSLALAICFWTLSNFSESVFMAIFGYLAVINLVLALFNLVPAFPLDGGRILHAYIWHQSGDPLKASRVASRSGVLFSYFLIAVGVLSLVQGSVVSGFWYVMIGGFIFLAARGNYQNHLAQREFSHLSVEDLMTSELIVTDPATTLDALAHEVFFKHPTSLVPVVEDNVLLGHIDKQILFGIENENWQDTKVGDVFAGLNETATVPPQMPAQVLLERIAKGEDRKFLVVDDHGLVGVVTLSDFTKFLHHKMAQQA